MYRYLQNPPRYQFLHCLRNRVKGGTSIFVDALRAAEQLRASSPDSFDLLSHVPVDFHYINDGHHLHHSHPTIELKPGYLRSSPSTQKASPEIAFINYSPPFQAPLPITTTSLFYPALADFVKFLRMPENRLEYTLREGDAVIFDNRRVLHARTEFSEWTEEERPAGVPRSEEGGTNRWLKGCYLEADAVWDKMRVLRTRSAQHD
jgi:gamma-butyrobetaine dioxygenase